ncbi:MAG TPA: nucleotidyltransferase domain-containing protein [Mycobacteriales bacterium]|nr:nucleotidyltransferase domain-containing protein [Mycobacteriales bacterium]
MPEAAAAILRRARTSARLSQPDLARRPGVAQSVISAYEAGRREPSINTLSKLVAATGHDLVVDLSPSSSPQRGLPDTPMGGRLRRNRRKILDAAALEGAGNVRVFGSVARGDNTADSDVDLLVDLEPGVGLFGLGRLERDLSGILRCPVDLIPADGVKPRIRDAVLADAVPL